MQMGRKNEVDILKYENLNYELAKGKRKVLVGGCFDILHLGHIEFLSRAKDIGEVLIVALESDKFIKKNKKKMPVHSQLERAKILSQLRSVDIIIILPLLPDYRSYYELVKKVAPSVIAVTEGDSQIDNKRKQADRIGAEVRIVCPNLKKFASSKIVSYASIFSD